MTIAPDTLAVLAALDPLLVALIVALAAIGLGAMAIWAAVRIGDFGGKK